MSFRETGHFLGRILLNGEAGAVLSDARIRLLEELDSKGSINQAAKAVPLTYKAAWEALDRLNNLAPRPLVARMAEDRRGGTRLTDYGRRLVALYRALESEMQVALQRLEGRLLEGEPGGVDDFRRMLQLMSVKSSARNQFAGPIVTLQDGGVDCEVCVRLDGGMEVVAVITHGSAQSLGLAVGKEVLVLVKASAVSIVTEAGARLPGCNQFWGEVAAIYGGGVHDEVTLALPCGRQMTAVVTHDSVQSLGLAVGQSAGAFFKASSVILSVYD